MTWSRCIAIALLALSACASRAGARPPPPDNDWTTRYEGSGPVEARIHNGSADELFVKLKDRSGLTVAQTAVRPHGVATVRLPSGTLRTLLRLRAAGSPAQHYEGPPLEVPPGPAELDLTLAHGMGGNLRSISESEFGQ